MSEHVVIIGAVALGPKAACRFKRLRPGAKVTMIDRDAIVSYGGCGIPYYISGDVSDLKELRTTSFKLVRDEAFFRDCKDIRVLARTEALAIDRAARNVLARNLDTGLEESIPYDKLVIATGASPRRLGIPGEDLPGVHAVANLHDAMKVRGLISAGKAGRAVVVGSGFIGLEVCENLKALGMDVTLLEKLPQVTPGLDNDMAVYVEGHIRHKGVAVLTGVTIDQITENSVVLSDGQEVRADMVLVSTGVRPNTELAAQAGIELGVAGAICVNTRMETNMPGIYACGDCIEQYHVVTGKPVYRPLGSTANKTGRIAGDRATGGDLEFRGILGTGIFKIFDITVAQTGLSEREAMELGYVTAVCHNIKPNKPEYMGAKEMVIKGIADKNTGRLIGVQIVGLEGVDKRIDVFVTAITYKAKVEDLFHLDLAYAPPFSTTKDPVMYTGMILDNAIHRGRPLMTAHELDSLIRSGEKYNLIDARAAAQYEKNHIETAKSIPHAKLRAAADSLDKDTVVITYCNKGTTGNAAQNILLNKGFKQVYNLSGGQKHFRNQNE